MKALGRALAVALLLTACSEQGGVFPAPFTADQLRDATKPGRTYVYRVERPGKPAELQEIRFTRVEQELAEIAVTVKDEDGKVQKTVAPSTARWTELRGHGEFPRRAVTTSETELLTPAGTFACVIYKVRRDDKTVDKLYFAKTLPGPPVFSVSEVDGHRVKTSTLVAYTPGP